MKKYDERGGFGASCGIFALWCVKMGIEKCGIYQIECRANWALYIGSSKQIYKRWNQHRCKLNRCKHTGRYLQHSWSKHGEDQFHFSILEECAEHELESREQHYIDTLKPKLNAITDVRRRYGKEVRERQRTAVLAYFKAQTHCKHGHEYTPENTYKDTKGYRRCVECSRERSRKVLVDETPEQREKRLTAVMKYQQKFKDALDAKKLEYRARTKDKKAAYDIAYRPIKNEKRRIAYASYPAEI